MVIELLVMKMFLLVLVTMSIFTTIFSSTDLNKVSAQESEDVFIAPGAADQSNLESFVPPEISISPETAISWRNDDSIEHTVTADDGSFASGPISPGDTFDNTFDSLGDFSYHCSIHPFMTGVVIVE
jgi:plastocyanin